MLLKFTSEACHLHLDLLHARRPDNDLRERVPHLALDGKLVCSHLVVAAYDLLRALNELVFEDVKTLLQLVKTGVDLALLCCELRVLVDL